jgi:hypothetical protein
MNRFAYAFGLWLAIYVNDGTHSLHENSMGELGRSVAKQDEVVYPGTSDRNCNTPLLYDGTTQAQVILDEAVRSSSSCHQH